MPIEFIQLNEIIFSNEERKTVKEKRLKEWSQETGREKLDFKGLRELSLKNHCIKD